MRLFPFFMEILPLVAFFVVYQSVGLIGAALASVGLAAVIMIFAAVRERRLATFPLFSLLLSALMTATAVLFGEALLIKLQPTVFNGLFALVLLGGLAVGKPVMKVFFAAQFRLTDATWFTLSKRWGVFFACLAVANELAWRMLDDDGWVFVKVFVLAPASGFFMLAQLPVTLRGRLPDQTTAEKDQPDQP